MSGVSGLVVAPADLVLGWNWVSRGNRVRFAVRFGVFVMLFTGLGKVWRFGGLASVQCCQICTVLVRLSLLFSVYVHLNHLKTTEL